MSKVRVILPITPVNTTFGRVLGVNTMNVNAFAEAEAELKRPGQLIPFVVGPSGQGANLTCLYEPPSGITQPPCDGPAEGNFGFMLPYLYGDAVIGTPIQCTPVASTTIASTLAKGADHIYALNSAVPGLPTIARTVPTRINSSTRSTCEPAIHAARSDRRPGNDSGDRRALALQGRRCGRAELD